MWILSEWRRWWLLTMRAKIGWKLNDKEKRWCIFPLFNSMFGCMGILSTSLCCCGNIAVYLRWLWFFVYFIKWKTIAYDIFIQSIHGFYFHESGIFYKYFICGIKRSTVVWSYGSCTFYCGVAIALWKETDNMVSFLVCDWNCWMFVLYIYRASICKLRRRNVLY